MGPSVPNSRRLGMGGFIGRFKDSHQEVSDDDVDLIKKQEKEKKAPAKKGVFGKKKTKKKGQGGSSIAWRFDLQMISVRMGNN